MKLLVVKLSSLGDVVHTFPALTDAARAIPGLVVDWAVEDAFVPLVKMHPAVRHAIPVPLRRLLKSPRLAWQTGAFDAVRKALRAETYDVIIDAQGLIKSAVIARMARGRRHGFDHTSAREGVASLMYSARHTVPEVEHMATRVRKLFAEALNYRLDDLPQDAGLRIAPAQSAVPYLVLLHGTTWKTKTWTVPHWRQLAQIAAKSGLESRIFAQGEAEIRRADAMASDLPCVRIMPPGPLEAQLPILAGAEAVVSVDSGFGHLAAALGIPTVGLYGPTNARLTGLYGPKVLELRSFRPCAPCERSHCRIAPETLEGPPCLADQQPREVWRALSVLRFGRADSMDKT